MNFFLMQQHHYIDINTLLPDVSLFLSSYDMDNLFAWKLFNEQSCALFLCKCDFKSSIIKRHLIPKKYDKFCMWIGWHSQSADSWRWVFTWIQLDRSICHIHRCPSLIITASYERSPAPIWSKPHWSHFHPHSFSLTAFSSPMHLLHM